MIIFTFPFFTNQRFCLFHIITKYIKRLLGVCTPNSWEILVPGRVFNNRSTFWSKSLVVTPMPSLLANHYTPLSLAFLTYGDLEQGLESQRERW